MKELDLRLESHVKWGIYNYPTLYRDTDYAKSRIRALNHIFLSYGTGLDWNTKTGILEDVVMPGRQTRTSLPARFFERRLWYILYLDIEKFKAGTRKPEWYYFTHGGDSLVFECSVKREAQRYERLYSQKHESGISFAHEAHCHQKWLGEDTVERPSDLCKYSPLVEILQGHTNPVGEPPVPFTPRPDWLAGCVEIARWAWEYWNDQERYQHSYYYVTSVMRQMEFDKKYDGYDWEKNLKPGQTPAQYADECWHRHWSEQKKYLHQFLERFGGQGHG